MLSLHNHVLLTRVWSYIEQLKQQALLLYVLGSWFYPAKSSTRVEICAKRSLFIE